MIMRNPPCPFTEKRGQVPPGNTASCCKWNLNWVLSAWKVLVHLKCPLKGIDHICLSNNSKLWWTRPLALLSFRHLSVEPCWAAAGIRSGNCQEIDFLYCSRESHAETNRKHLPTENITFECPCGESWDSLGHKDCTWTSLLSQSPDSGCTISNNRSDVT